MTPVPEPMSLLISALGGEGGGVLARWIVDAAEAEGYAVAATSVPGVAQRTGATTYYVEIVAEVTPPDAPEPVLCLAPTPGCVDVVVATELAEAARSAARGFVTPARTTLLGATHRVLAIDEKTHGADGRADAKRLRDAVTQLARRALWIDARRLGEQARSHANSVLLGALAASEVLPIPVAGFRTAIRRQGREVEANLRGFEAGLVAEADPPDTVAEAAITPELPSALRERVAALTPQALRAVVAHGVARVVDHQDEGEALLYLDRVKEVRALDPDPERAPVAVETARQLALAMAYEDVVRVAQLKARSSRLERISAEVGATAGDVVHVVEYLDPGLDELASLLPARLGRRLEAWAAHGERRQRWRWPLKVSTTSAFGHLQLWLLARLRPLRRLGHRYRQERAEVERWLAIVGRATQVDPQLGLEVAACAELVRGYADTRRRGRVAFERIIADGVMPALAGSLDVPLAIARVRGARRRALAAPEEPDTQPHAAVSRAPPAAAAAHRPEA